MSITVDTKKIVSVIADDHTGSSVCFYQGTDAREAEEVESFIDMAIELVECCSMAPTVQELLEISEILENNSYAPSCMRIQPIN